MRKFLGLLFPMLIMGAAVAVACGGDSKTVKIPGGGEISTSDKVPDDFPDDYPIYGGAKVTGSISGTNQGITGTSVTWETGDSLEKVTDFYNDKFASGAWKATSNGQIADSSYWTGENSDGTKAHYVSVSRTDDKTNIVVVVGDKEDGSSSSSDDDSDSSDSSDDDSDSSSSSDDSDDSDSSSSSSPEAAELPAEVKIAKDFPTDKVPFPSGARITSSSSFGGGGSQTYSVELYVKDDAEAISDFFGEELPKKGWTNAFTSNSDGQYYLTFSKESTDTTQAESVTAAVAESDVEGYSTVSLLVTSTTQ